MATLAQITGRVLKRGKLVITSDDLAVRIGDGSTQGQDLPRLVSAFRNGGASALLYDTNTTVPASLGASGSFTGVPGAISSNEWALIGGKNLIIDAGFGPPVGQITPDYPASYVKGLGFRGKHRGDGNMDYVWGSWEHSGPREFGLVIGDVKTTFGGNAYGEHFYVEVQNTAPKFVVGASFEIVPRVARGTTSAATLATTIPAGSPVSSVELAAAVQLTRGTNLAMTAANGSTVTFYVASDMPAASTTVPIRTATPQAQITAATAVTVGVTSAWYGNLIRNSGAYGISAGVQIEAPEYTGNRATTPPFLVALNFDASAASPLATAIKIGGSYGTGLDMNANTITQVGSVTAVADPSDGNAKNFRIVEYVLVDNNRGVKAKDTGGTPRLVFSLTGSDNTRLLLGKSTGQFEFVAFDGATTLARITASGRGDFSVGGITLPHVGSATPTGGTSGDVKVGTGKLWANDAGTWKSVAIA